MRGEKKICWNIGLLCLGSPPHARGKEFIYMRRTDTQGITPACAGKRLVSCVQKYGTKDHPRMRGEKQHEKACDAADEGSPPHARGKAINPGLWQGREGITPACAGKSRLDDGQR